METINAVMNQGTVKFKMGLGGVLRNVSYQIHQSFTKALKSSSVSVAEWAVLRLMYLSDDTIASSEIARTTGMTRGAVSKLIDKTIKKGLVSRRESKSDRRYQVIKLTKKGKALVPKLDKMTNAMNEHYFSCLTITEQKTLERLLQKVAEENQFTEVPIQ